MKSKIFYLFMPSLLEYISQVHHATFFISTGTRTFLLLAMFTVAIKGALA